MLRWWAHRPKGVGDRVEGLKLGHSSPTVEPESLDRKAYKPYSKSRAYGRLLEGHKGAWVVRLSLDVALNLTRSRKKPLVLNPTVQTTNFLDLKPPKPSKSLKNPELCFREFGRAG